jgi:acyl carrier protein
MDDLVLNKIKRFLESDRWGLGEREIKRSTRIEQDLRLTGNDAVEFIVAFGKEFGVDITNFMANEYFDAEGIIHIPFENVINSLIDFLFGIKNKKHKKVLTIEDLERAIELKELR